MKMTARNNAMIVYSTLLTVSLAWIGLIFAAPWLMAKRHFLAATFIYRGFFAVCHQMPERSFHFHGFPLGVCSRCAAIYIGFVCGLMTYLFARDLSEERYPARWVLIASGVPMLIDVAGEFIGLFENTFLSRSLTGSLFGAVAAFYILPGLVSTINEWRAGFAANQRRAR